MKLSEDIINPVRYAIDNENDAKMMTVFALGKQ